MALVMVTLVKEHGLQYLLAATILTGIIQIVLAYLGENKTFMRIFVARAVVVGFVNALAILIFMAQLPELVSVTWHVYALTIIGLGIIYLYPYVPKLENYYPLLLLQLFYLQFFVYFVGWDVRNVEIWENFLILYQYFYGLMFL